MSDFLEGIVRRGAGLPAGVRAMPMARASTERPGEWTIEELPKPVDLGNGAEPSGLEQTSEQPSRSAETMAGRPRRWLNTVPPPRSANESMAARESSRLRTANPGRTVATLEPVQRAATPAASESLPPPPSMQPGMQDEATAEPEPSGGLPPTRNGMGLSPIVEDQTAPAPAVASPRVEPAGSSAVHESAGGQRVSFQNRAQLAGPRDRTGEARELAFTDDHQLPAAAVQVRGERPAENVAKAEALGPSEPMPGAVGSAELGVEVLNQSNVGPRIAAVVAPNPARLQPSTPPEPMAGDKVEETNQLGHDLQPGRLVTSGHFVDKPQPSRASEAAAAAGGLVASLAPADTRPSGTRDVASSARAGAASPLQRSHIAEAPGSLPVVTIGRVEVHMPPPPPQTPAARPPLYRRGFAEMAAARRYLDRVWW